MALSGELIAFYGTLMSAAPPLPDAPRLEGRVDVVSACVLEGTLHDLGSYPALAPGTGRVRGELCLLRDPDVLAILDAWEDFRPDDEASSEYVRRWVRLLEPDVGAWTYMFNRPHRELPEIADGDWLAHLARRGGAPGATRWG